MLRFTLSCLVVVAVAGCQAVETTTTTQACRAGSFLLTGNFENGRLGSCRSVSDSQVVLANSPEDQPINHSPWYAFQVVQGTGALQIEIEYAVHQHRYWPKLSFDGEDWFRLEPARVTPSADGSSVVLDLQVDRTPLWVAGQEVLTEAWYLKWLERVGQNQGIQSRVLGHSVAGRDILAFETNPSADATVVLVGRQHPPEVTGALAMQGFVDRLLEASSSACTSPNSTRCNFFRNANFLVVPLLNPDGVALGHWRHGLGRMDLNRDWGPFTQPETQAMQAELNRLSEAGKQVLLFIDFHSTQRNLFYTQSEAEEESIGNHFATRWLDLARVNGIYKFEQQRRHNQGRPTAKNYMFDRFDVPAITYEVGDETDRVAIRESAYVLADAMVDLLSE